MKSSGESNVGAKVDNKSLPKKTKSQVMSSTNVSSGTKITEKSKSNRLLKVTKSQITADNDNPEMPSSSIMNHKISKNSIDKNLNIKSTSVSIDSGGGAKTRERSSSNRSGRSKRKTRPIMAQIVKQVRRGKRGTSGPRTGRGKQSPQQQSYGKLRKSSSSGATKSTATINKCGKSASATGIKSKSSARSKSNRRKKTSRSLQQLHVLEKSVFRSRLDSHSVSAEPWPYRWTNSTVTVTSAATGTTSTQTPPPQSNILDSKASSGQEIVRSASQCSLVGKSIIYRDDDNKHGGLDKYLTTNSIITSLKPPKSGGGGGEGGVGVSEDGSQNTSDDFVTLQSLRDEIARCETNDIFETGPFD